MDSILEELVEGYRHLVIKEGVFSRDDFQYAPVFYDYSDGGLSIRYELGFPDEEFLEIKDDDKIILEYSDGKIDLDIDYFIEKFPEKEKELYADYAKRMLLR